MWRVLLEDSMYEGLAVIDTTAFMRRTSAPVFDPLHDGWEHQVFNARRFPVDLEAGWRARAHRHVASAKRSILRARPRPTRSRNEA